MDEHYETPEVAVADFFQSVLPAVSSDTVDKIMAHLVATGRFFCGDTPSWDSIPERPSESTGSENDTFGALSGIYWDIIAAFKHLFPGQEEVLTLIQRSNGATPIGRSTNACSGGYFILTDGNNTSAKWNNIVMICEFKNSNQTKEGEQNAKQLLWGMHHVMCNDYRRFTFGLTIEDFTTRIWFCDRSENMVSQPFELDKEPKLLVHFFVALAFASYVNLGFDPTIEQLPNGKISILVHGTTNGIPVVTKYISDPQDDLLGVDRVDPLNGRGTRVWRVRKEGDVEGIFYVLKESWIISGQKLEGDFLRKFKEDIKGKGVTEDLALFDELFMGVVADGLVEPSPGKKDCTLETIRRGIPPRVDRTAKLYAPYSWTNVPPQSLSYGGPPAAPDPWSTSIQPPSAIITRKKTYRPRKHYRIVLSGWEGKKEEVGKALHEIGDLRQILCCLPKLIDAIGLLYRYDRLHRDISTGNVIVRTDNVGNITDVKLSDLEYARKGGGEPGQDTRIGTYQFMSMEVYLGDYLCITPSQPIDLSMARSLSRPRVTSTRPKFTHNVLHELESVWWIMIWAILHRYPSVSTGYSLGQDNLEELREQKALLFDPANSINREKAVRYWDGLGTVLDLLPQSPIIVALASQFRFGKSPFHWWYVHLMADWDRRDEIFACAISEFRQFAMDVIQCTTVSN